MKKTYFLRFLFRNIRKIPYENPFFSEVSSTIFLPYTVITLVILNAEFGLIWPTPWPDEKDFFLILKISHFAKFAKFRMKNNFFS